MIPAIGKLVTAIQSRWHAANFDEDRFAVIAAEELGESRLSEHLDIAGLVRWFVHETGAAPQINVEVAKAVPFAVTPVSETVVLSRISFTVPGALFDA